MRRSRRRCLWTIVPCILINGGFSCVSNSPIPCETDAECDDGRSCTVDLCGDDLFCRNTTIVCPQGQICVPASGVCENGECAIHEHCDDRVFCNGVESCNFVSRTCGPGPLPCSEDQICQEGLRRCRDVECMVDEECDDGVNCTTDTCNDFACSNIEMACPSGQFCIELTGACMVSDCGTDADCDDGLFCNGLEFCRLLTRSCESTTAVPCIEEGVRCNETLQRCENIRCVTGIDCPPGQRCSVSGACVSF